MAKEIPGLMWSAIAGADLTTHQYKAVKLNSSGLIVLAGLNEPVIVGFLQTKTATGVSGTIMSTGITHAISGTGGVVVGPAATDASGRLLAAGANPVVAYVIEGAASADLRVTALIL